MSKTKAPARAKAKAAAKATKPDSKDALPSDNVRAGHFDNKSNVVQNMDYGVNIKSVAGMRRGGARSR